MRNLILIIALVVSTLFFSDIFAQTAAEGENLFNSRQYAKAKTVYAALLKRNPKDALNNYRYARCCYELKEYETAITHFELSGTRYPLTPMYLGEVYFLTYRFDKSVQAYRTYIESLDPDDKKIPEFEQKIRTSELGVRLMNRIEDIAIIDSIVVNKNEFLKFYKHSRETGTLTHERIKLNNKQIHDKIGYTTERGDRMFLSDSLNGNMNLFTSIKLLDKWSKPTALSTNINSMNNENYPFLLLDGLTLYFAADGENTLGGYDIFYTRYSPPTKDYLNPENVGFPFNSTANDYMMVIDDLQKTGWFASDRHQPVGKIVIYRFELNNPKKYFRSDNDEANRQVAQLIKYRKADKTKFKKTNEPENIITESIEDNFYIVINDSLVYQHLDQFQSMQALEAFREWISLRKTQDILEQKLLQLRTEYNNGMLSDNDKIKITETLKEIEQLWINNENSLKNKYIEASNQEIKFIDKN